MSSTNSPATNETTLYGMFPSYLVAQRASSVQATSALASSSDFGAAQLAWAVEVSNTLIALGVWKGAA